MCCTSQVSARGHKCCSWCYAHLLINRWSDDDTAHLRTLGRQTAEMVCACSYALKSVCMLANFVFLLDVI